jgi:hypothetical protein
VIDIGPTSNGKRSYRVNAATVAAVFSVLGSLLYAAGYVTSSLPMSGHLAVLQIHVAQIQASLDSVSTRLTKLEDKVDYTAQGVADLKALKAGTNR